MFKVNGIEKVFKEKNPQISKSQANVDCIYPQMKKRKSANETVERSRKLFDKIIPEIYELSTFQ